MMTNQNTFSILLMKDNLRNSIRWHFNLNRKMPIESAWESVCLSILTRIIIDGDPNIDYQVEHPMKPGVMLQVKDILNVLHLWALIPKN